ncbi:hypothetical protein [Gracilibacillus massiliensis]|uniref:hypothetical protein n=1 Tax=Gracilibacillus massiliensis TaxID=1564956 RepID=UPI00071DDEAF|nr:hypothetical protein [Gracilibacillus massiliensis]
MHDKEQKPFLDIDKVEQEIKTIVAKGVMVPAPFHKLLQNMYKQIGIRFLLRDTKEIAIVITMMVILMVSIVVNGHERPNSTSSFYGMIMCISPILYGLLSLLPFFNSKTNGTFEVEMTSKYNLYQLAAFRMLVFSVFCFLLNTIWVLSMAVKFSSIHFVQAFMISTTSLLLFSLLFLYVLTNLKTMFTKLAVMMGWMGINVLLLMIDSAFYHQLLVAIPWYLYGIIIILTPYLYVKKLKEFILLHKRRGVIHYVNG